MTGSVAVRPEARQGDEVPRLSKSVDEAAHHQKNARLEVLLVMGDSGEVLYRKGGRVQIDEDASLEVHPVIKGDAMQPHIKGIEVAPVYCHIENMNNPYQPNAKR